MKMNQRNPSPKENPTADLPIDEPGDIKNFQYKSILVPSGNQAVFDCGWWWPW